MMMSGNELIQIMKFIDKLPDPIIIIDYVNDKLSTNSSVKKCFKNIKLNKFEDLKKIIPLKVLAELNSFCPENKKIAETILRSSCNYLRCLKCHAKEDCENRFSGQTLLSQVIFMTNSHPL